MIPCPHCDRPALLDDDALRHLHQQALLEKLGARVTVTIACRRCPFSCGIPFIVLDRFDEFLELMNLLVRSHYALWLCWYLSGEPALTQLAKIASYSDKGEA